RTVLFSIREKWCEIAGDFTTGDRVIYFLHEAKSSFSLYILLTKEFVLKSWMANAIWCLGSASGGCVVIDLVYSLAECYRSDIWLPAAKLRTFYEKHNLLPCNRFVVLTVTGLLDLWAADVVYSLGIRLGIHMSFGLCPRIAGLGFGFLCNIFLINLVNA
ncbi:hypothetical protein G9A89_004919, partial [Geosiphon pyriformis]